MENRLKIWLDEASARSERRKLAKPLGAQGAEVNLDGKKVVNFCSNNYLGLAAHPKLIEAARSAAALYGCGAGASRLLSGNLVPAEELEASLCRYKGTEAALVFPTGYHANVGLLTALLGPGDLAFSARRNHASLIDGLRLSGARKILFRHDAIDGLEGELKSAPSAAVRAVVVEGLFSMDGDIVPLDRLAALKRCHGFWLIVDDAHGHGALGEKGRGVAELFPEAAPAVDAWTGTLSKAFGSQGGFVAGSATLRDYLINRARPFVYSTGIAPAACAAARRALELIDEEPALTARLHDNVRRLWRGLKEIGAPPPPFETPIAPVVFGENEAALEASAALFEKGLWAPAIRPPTVESGKARLRLSITAEHTAGQIDRLLEAISAAAERYGLAAA